MSNFVHSFVLTFVPLFVVLDVLGNLPIIISLTENMTSSERYRVVNIAMATATILGVLFLFFGQLILNVLGISVGSFAIAGGIILLILSTKQMISGHMVHVVKEEMIAVVPIGTPLVVGPATITTLLVLSNDYPLYIILITFILNLMISWIAFLLSSQIIRIIGLGGLRAISRVFSLLLAAIAISMLVHGLKLVELIT
jgi:multiple antibiotic resistance protein